MSISCEIHRAEWDIPYPVGCDMASIPNVLRPFTNVEHELESFPWHMAGQLVKQLENPEANFEYLHLTKYCLARAALLAIKGDVLDRADLHTALCKHQVQFGGIYRKHLIRVFRNFLEKHNIANLPECDIYMIDPLHGSGQVAKNRDLLQCLIYTAEFDYTNTLIFLSLAPEADEKIFDQTAGYWGRGGEMPKASSVPVLVTTHATGYYIKPCKADAKRMTCAGRRMQTISVRNQEEFPFVTESVGRKEPGGRHPLTGGEKPVTSKPASVGSECKNTEHGRPHAKVLGDFNVIVLPGGRERIDLTSKHKGRAFLQFIHQRLSETGTDEFYDEEMREAFNSQFSRNLAHRQWRSDRFRDDLFRGKELEFDQLFETLDKCTGHYRMKVSFEMTKMTRRRK